jgi:hypothetical protein
VLGELFEGAARHRQRPVRAARATALGGLRTPPRAARHRAACLGGLHPPRQHRARDQPDAANSLPTTTRRRPPPQCPTTARCCPLRHRRPLPPTAPLPFTTHCPPPTTHCPAAPLPTARCPLPHHALPAAHCPTARCPVPNCPAARYPATPLPHRCPLPTAHCPLPTARALPTAPLRPLPPTHYPPPPAARAGVGGAGGRPAAPISRRWCGCGPGTRRSRRPLG